MTPLAIVGALALAHLAAALSPGPNTALVVAAAIRSRRSALPTAVGFRPAGAFWSPAGFAGMGAVFAAAPGLGLVAGVYLIHLGIKALLRSFQSAAARGPEVAPRLWYAAVRAGFLTNITNPKLIAYDMSVFAATGAFALPPSLRLLAILMLPSIGVLWYGALAQVLSTPALRRRTRAIERCLDRISGATMVLFGCKLVIGR